MKTKINSLNQNIIKCIKCKRLVDFREKVAEQKTKRFINEDYWGKPVIGFGDIKAKIIILGLAPAAHGGNRTGRVFTGDRSADFLFRCMYKVNLANQPNSKHMNDGLILKNVYMTPVLKCVPPNDKPKQNELKNCFSFLTKEIKYLKNAQILLALGKVAFDACLKLFNSKRSENVFKHGMSYPVGKNLTLFACYHPSPRNVNTGRVNEEMMLKVLKKVKKS